jgi:hypothetical protein
MAAKHAEAQAAFQQQLQQVQVRLNKWLMCTQAASQY